MGMPCIYLHTSLLTFILAIPNRAHRIYYPYGSTNITSAGAAKLANPVTNPWLVPICKPQKAYP